MWLTSTLQRVIDSDDTTLGGHWSRKRTGSSTSAVSCMTLEILHLFCSVRSMWVYLPNDNIR